jgi:hypothetical protein
MADILQFDEYQHGKAYQEGPTRQGKLAHELIEQHFGGKGKRANYKSSHAEAVRHENLINGNERLIEPNGKFNKQVDIQTYVMRDGRKNKFEVQFAQGAFSSFMPIIKVSPYYGDK